MTVVPVVFVLVLGGLAMTVFSLFLWTEFTSLRVVGGALGVAGMCTALWWLYDSFGPQGLAGPTR